METEDVESNTYTTFHSFVLQLEAGVWDQKRVLDRSRTKNGPQALSRLITKLDKSIALYGKKTPKLTMTRRKRDLYHLKNKILLDDFRSERCGLEMMRCDGVSTVLNYHINRCRLLDAESSFLQPREMYLNTNVEKYPKTLLGIALNRIFQLCTYLVTSCSFLSSFQDNTNPPISSFLSSVPNRQPP